MCFGRDVNYSCFRMFFILIRNVNSGDILKGSYMLMYFFLSPVTIILAVQFVNVFLFYKAKYIGN